MDPDRAICLAMPPNWTGWRGVLLEERRKRVSAYKDIVGRIKRLHSENELDVLFYRYIKGLEWWEIAEKMGYSERQIHRYHGNALAHISVPENLKDVIECQSKV